MFYRLVILVICLLIFRPAAAQLPYYTGQQGNNPLNFPAMTQDMNVFVQRINQQLGALGPGGTGSFSSLTVSGNSRVDKIAIATGPSANLNTTGATLPSSATSPIFESMFAFGKPLGSSPSLHFFSTSDQMNPANVLNDYFFNASVGGGGFHGNRNVLTGSLQLLPTPGVVTGGNQVAIYGQALTNPGTYGNGYGGINTPGAYSQSIWALDLLSQVNASKNIGGQWGIEVDVDTQTTDSIASKVGIQVTNLPDGAGAQGIFNDQAFAIVNQNDSSARWVCGYCIGAATSSWPIDHSQGTGIGFVSRLYSGVEVQQLLYGVDGRVLTVTSGGEAIALPNMAVDGGGGVHAASVGVAGAIRGETATLTGLTILADPTDGVTGGLYTSIPTLTVSAPPSGVTATATVATMSLGRIVGFGSTGSAYTVNDILTGTGGGSGTQPTYKVTAIDGNGGITTCAVNSVGSLTTFPTTAVVYPTGGTGSGGGFNVVYNSTGPTSCTPAVTGKNYVAGNTLSTGGTGTQGVLTIDTVDAFGGVLTAHQTTPGSLTALPSVPAAVAGGAGSGASLKLGFSIATTTLTPGSGYVNAPPVVTATQSPYRTARFNAQPTPAESALSINPGGQAVTVGGTIGTGGYTVSTLPTSTIGARAYVTDATACTFGSTPTGGASTFCPVIYTGSAWIEG